MQGAIGHLTIIVMAKEGINSRPLRGANGGVGVRAPSHRQRSTLQENTTLSGLDEVAESISKVDSRRALIDNNNDNDSDDRKNSVVSSVSNSKTASTDISKPASSVTNKAVSKDAEQVNSKREQGKNGTFSESQSVRSGTACANEEKAVYSQTWCAESKKSKSASFPSQVNEIPPINANKGFYFTTGNNKKQQKESGCINDKNNNSSDNNNNNSINSNDNNTFKINVGVNGLQRAHTFQFANGINGNSTHNDHKGGGSSPTAVWKNPVLANKTKRTDTLPIAVGLSKPSQLLGPQNSQHHHQFAVNSAISKHTVTTFYTQNTFAIKSCKTPPSVALAVKKREEAKPSSREGDSELDRPVPFENVKLDHEKVDIRPTKNIKMKQYLCVKPALPKTRLTNTILYENVSHDRHLEMKLAGLRHDKVRSAFTMDLNRRAFMAQQDRKRTKWRREDEVRVSAMNLPTFSPTPEDEKKAAERYGGSEDDDDGGAGGGARARDVSVGVKKRRASVETLYHMSGAEYGRGDSPEAGARKPLLPMMKIRRERTEILSHHDKVFLTRLPAVVEVNQQKLQVHENYCGKTLLNKGQPIQDERFRRLQTKLSAAVVKDNNNYGNANLKKKNKFSKYAPSADSSEQTLPLPPSRHLEARVIVASRGKSIPLGPSPKFGSAPPPGLGSRQRTSFDFVTEMKKSEAGRALGGERGREEEERKGGGGEPRKRQTDFYEDSDSQSSDPKERDKEVKPRETILPNKSTILKSYVVVGWGGQSEDSSVATTKSISLPTFDGARDLTNMADKEATSITKPSTVPGAQTHIEILQMFKNNDIKALARSLTADATGFRIGTGLKLGLSYKCRGAVTEKPSIITAEPRPLRHPRNKLFAPVIDVFHKVQT